MRCALCNEFVEEQEFILGTAMKTEDDEVWHVDCHAEYFDLALDEMEA